MKTKQKGFTLIELLIVIAIIGLLSVIVMSNLSNTRARSRDIKRVSDIRQYMAALELYYNANNLYPISNTTQAMVPGLTTGVGALVTGGYIAAFQAAPVPADNCSIANNTYYYQANSSSGGSTYQITFCLGNSVGTNTPFTAGLHTASPGRIQ